MKVEEVERHGEGGGNGDIMVEEVERDKRGNHSDSGGSGETVKVEEVEYDVGVRESDGLCSHSPSESEPTPRRII